MEYEEILAAAWENLPTIVAIVLVVLFGIACWNNRPVKAGILFISVIFSVILGVV